MSTITQHVQRVHLEIGGAVQGVGFRPYAYRLARSLELAGFVRNDARGVIIEVEGDEQLVEQFIARLPVETPPLANCDRITRRAATVAGETSFAILASENARDHTQDCSTSDMIEGTAQVMPDVATCADCFRELFDPTDRRYRYPFINCTNCGPRFTIVQGVPYDRSRTTMAGFTICAECKEEYETPADRRFHAQPNACPRCGPQARWSDPAGRQLPLGDAQDAVMAAARALRNGAIVAVKGVGGYHLACLASDTRAVTKLRARKHRAAKPFAVMAPDVASAKRLVALDDTEVALLTSPARPIVLARRHADADVANDVAPALALAGGMSRETLGVMLPYSPLHHLLLADVGAPLVMTSGNVSDEPIAFIDDDAFERLGSLADAFLTHDRPIQTRVDDSVVRMVTIGGERRPLMVRRSRGYVPAPVPLPFESSSTVLACGGQLKNTFCLVRKREAWVGPHIGDLESYETLQSYRNGIAHLERLVAVQPEGIAYDLHPEYLSTKYAIARAEGDSLAYELAERQIAVEGVQHHHAHFAAGLAEYGERGLAVGAIFDGTGYGTDGNVWGGEILVGDLSGCTRVAHLWPVRLPGGEAAVREPWRMACAWLAELTPDGVPELPRTLVPAVSVRDWRAVTALARSGIGSPRTTSMGRLLDAIASLCGVRHRVSYEGQAAIELEALADHEERGRYALPKLDADGVTILDARAVVHRVLTDLAAGLSIGQISARVHNGVAYAAAQTCAAIAARHHVKTIVLSGGVFQNVLLVERTADALLREGMRVLIPRHLPVNDGGLSFGQAAVAVSRLLESSHS